MKKLFYIFFMLMFVTSCTNTEKNNQEPIVDIAQNSIESSTGDTNLESDSWIIDDSETVKSDEDLWKVLSMEEQYCKSKWGKIAFVDETNVCFVTDDIGLLKCDVNIFYLDKCRDKSAKIKNWIVVDADKTVVKTVKKVENTNEKEVLSTGNEKNKSNVIVENPIKETTAIVQKNLWSGFIFKEDGTSKYLYLGDKLITQFDKNWKILMWLNNWDIYPFNIYLDKTDKEPSKIINVNILNKSFTESKTKFASEKTNTWIVETNSWTTKITTTGSTDTKTTLYKSKVGLSWTYYISGTNLNIKTSSWEIKTLFSSKDWDLSDFELMLNKQIKVLYYPWDSKILEEKIIDVK